MHAAAKPAVALMMLLLLGVAGCDGQRRETPVASKPSAEAAKQTVGVEKPAAAVPDCGRALLNVRSLLTIALARIPGAIGPLQRGLAIAEASCREDAWPEPLRRCLAEVPLVGADGSTAGLWRCEEHVPPSVRAKLEPKLRALAQ